MLNWMRIKFFRHTVAGMLLLFGMCLFVLPASANSNVHKKKYAAFVMDAYTGTVLHRHNAGKRLHPASLTKLMTLMLVFEALEEGRLNLYDRAIISTHAASMIPSKLGLPPGSTIKIKDAIHALSVKSANDVAVAIAEKLGGNERNFAKMMTAKAREIGMTNTKFMNASGLHHPRQVSTARDMAKLARVLLTDYEKYYPYFSRKSFKYRGKTYKSHNKLLKSYAGMDGFKTGYIRASGFNLVSSAERDGTRLIGVVFGGKTGDLRNKQMRKILDQSFAKSGAILMARVPVPDRKPVRALQTASSGFDYIAPSSGKADRPVTEFFALTKHSSRWDMLKDGSLLMGQGDADMVVRKRIETGLIAVSAHLKEDIPAEVWGNELDESAPALASAKGSWAVQVGAFSTRARTESAITTSLAALPANLRYGQSMIAPLQTQEGWIFRGRLHGYTKREARKACRALDDCIAIAPHALHR